MISSAAVALTLAAVNAETPEITHPRLLSPEASHSECYPMSSRQLQREGRVTVTVTINADGSVGDVEFPPGTEPWQKETGLCLLPKLRFAAGTQDGKPVAMQATLPIGFELTDESGRPRELAWPKLRSTEDDYDAAFRDCYPANSSAVQEALYKVTIGTDGRARNIEVVQSGGDPVLDKAGACVIRKIRFQPAQKGGMAVKSTITLPLEMRPPRQPR